MNVFEKQKGIDGKKVMSLIELYISVKYAVCTKTLQRSTQQCFNVEHFSNHVSISFAFLFSMVCILTNISGEIQK